MENGTIPRSLATGLAVTTIWSLGLGWIAHANDRPTAALGLWLLATLAAGPLAGMLVWAGWPIRGSVSTLAIATQGTQSSNPSGPLSLEEQLERDWNQATAAGSLIHLTAVHQRAGEILSIEALAQLDERTATWLVPFVQRELLAGRAIDIIDDLDRLVQLLGEHPAMQPLLESMPTIRQSAHIFRMSRQDDD